MRLGCAVAVVQQWGSRKAGLVRCRRSTRSSPPTWATGWTFTSARHALSVLSYVSTLVAATVSVRMLIGVPGCLWVASEGYESTPHGALLGHRCPRCWGRCGVTGRRRRTL